jgi:hypothetical protein
MRDEQLVLLEGSMVQYGLEVDMGNSRSLNSAGYGLYEKKNYAGAVRFFREAAYVDISNETRFNGRQKVNRSGEVGADSWDTTLGTIRFVRNFH